MKAIERHRKHLCELSLYSEVTNRPQKIYLGWWTNKFLVVTYKDMYNWRADFHQVALVGTKWYSDMTPTPGTKPQCEPPWVSMAAVGTRLVYVITYIFSHLSVNINDSMIIWDNESRRGRYGYCLRKMANAETFRIVLEAMWRNSKYMSSKYIKIFNYAKYKDEVWGASWI